MTSDPIRVGDTYVDVNPPRRKWRIVEQRRREQFTLERVDKPRVLRFLDTAALRDRTRYVPGRAISG
ncbi:MAG TPA: hypothetical protein VGB82_04120 [Alphaproteobacteria bacterium]